MTNSHSSESHNLNYVREKKNDLFYFVGPFSTLLWVWTMIWEYCALACGSLMKRLMTLKKLFRVSDVSRKKQRHRPREEIRSTTLPTQESDIKKIEERKNLKPKNVPPEKINEPIKKRKERLKGPSIIVEKPTPPTEDQDPNIPFKHILEVFCEPLPSETPIHDPHKIIAGETCTTATSSALKLSEAKERCHKKSKEVVEAKQTKEELSKIKLELSTQLQRQYTRHDCQLTEPLLKVIVDEEKAHSNLKKRESELLAATMKEKFLKLSFTHRTHCVNNM